MKFVFIINSAQNQRCIKRVNEFVERGYDVEAYAFSRCTEMRNKPNFDLRIIGEFANKTPYFARLNLMLKAIKQVLTSTKHDKEVVYYLFGLDIAMLFRVLSRKPYLFEESDLMHTYMHKKLARDVMERIDKYIIRKSRLTVFTSEGFARYHFGDAYPANICFIPNRLSPAVADIPAAARQPLNQEHLRFAFVGGARFESVARFAESVAKHFPQHEFHFFGHVDVNYQERYDALRQYPNVFFHGPFRNPDDLPRIYAQTDLVLSTYDVKFDNVRYAEPNKLYEAVYFEVPIIVSCGTFLAERVSELGIGYAVDPLDERAVVGLVSSLSAADIERKQAAARALGKEWALNRNDAFFERIAQLDEV